MALMLVLALQIDIFLQRYGENGLLTSDYPFELVLAYVNALCAMPESNCLSTGSPIWLLLDAVYEGSQGMEYVDASTLVDAVRAAM